MATAHRQGRLRMHPSTQMCDLEEAATLRRNVLLRDMGAAVMASLSIPTATNWVDNAKTRMQAPRAPACTAAPYRGGLLTTASRIVAEEGVLSLLSTGIVASYNREAMTQIVRVGLYVRVRDSVSIATGLHEPW